jgi:hypothetical protein
VAILTGDEGARRIAEAKAACSEPILQVSVYHHDGRMVVDLQMHSALALMPLNDRPWLFIADAVVAASQGLELADKLQSHYVKKRVEAHEPQLPIELRATTLPQGSRNN